MCAPSPSSSPSSRVCRISHSPGLIGCENSGRRVSRGVLGEKPETLAGEYNGKRLNSPNDLWIDAAGGIDFTDPHYGPREEIEQGVEAVYYIAEFGFVSGETQYFDIAIQPAGETRPLVLQFNHVLYAD